MSTVELPIKDRNDAQVYGFLTTLSGVDFLFNFYFNQSDDMWYFDIFDVAGTALRRGVKVVVSQPLLHRNDPGLPIGMLMALDLSNEFREATKEDFGDRVKMFYTSDDDG